MGFIWGLVGPVGSGKSTVGQLFQHLGWSVMDIDEINRQVLRQVDIQEQLFKKYPMIPKEFNRQRVWLRRRMLDDSSCRSFLEQTLLPEVKQKAITWCHDQQQHAMIQLPTTRSLCLSDYPLKGVIGVDASESVRKLRLLEKQWAEKSIEQIMSIQLPVPQNTDYVIINDGELNNLLAQVEHVHTKILGQ